MGILDWFKEEETEELEIKDKRPLEDLEELNKNFNIIIKSLEKLGLPNDFIQFPYDLNSDINIILNFMYSKGYEPYNLDNYDYIFKKIKGE